MNAIEKHNVMCIVTAPAATCINYEQQTFGFLNFSMPLHGVLMHINTYQIVYIRHSSPWSSHHWNWNIIMKEDLVRSFIAQWIAVNYRRYDLKGNTGCHYSWRDESICRGTFHGFVQLIHFTCVVCMKYKVNRFGSWWCIINWARLLRAKLIKWNRVRRERERQTFLHFSCVSYAQSQCLWWCAVCDNICRFTVHNEK